jgi:hypothetical protein
LAFLTTAPAVPPGVRLCAALIAAADASHVISAAGDDALRRLGAVSVEEDDVVGALYALLLGGDGGARGPAPPSLQTRVLTGYLGRSVRAAHLLESALPVIANATAGTPRRPHTHPLP